MVTTSQQFCLRELLNKVTGEGDIDGIQPENIYHRTVFVQRDFLKNVLS